MCSIFGMFNRVPEDPSYRAILRQLAYNAGDRGRDGMNDRLYTMLGGGVAYLGSHRATPTQEVLASNPAPYGGIHQVVHNGTIWNDKELGVQPGEIDSEVLPRVLNFDNVYDFADSLQKVKGSYAIAAFTGGTIYLAANFKPLHYWSPNGGDTIYFSSMARHFKGIVPVGVAPVTMEPYTALNLANLTGVNLHQRDDRKAIVIASAGMDSTVVAAMLKQRGHEVLLVHYQYGALAQTNESKRIPLIAKALGCDYKIMPLDYSHMREGAALLGGDDSKLADALESAESPSEWVYARNLLMLAHTTAYAEAHGYHTIALGNNLEEAGSHPDNEEQFTHLFNGLLPYAVQPHYRMKVVSPIGHLMKTEIVKVGMEVGAPLEYTWSCYRSGVTPCGRCGSCLLRATAFERAGYTDPAESFTPPTDWRLEVAKKLHGRMI